MSNLEVKISNTNSDLEEDSMFFKSIIFFPNVSSIYVEIFFKLLWKHNLQNFFHTYKDCKSFTTAEKPRHCIYKFRNAEQGTPSTANTCVFAISCFIGGKLPEDPIFFIFRKIQTEINIVSKAYCVFIQISPLKSH